MNYLGIEFKWELRKNEKKFIKYLIDNDFKIIKYKQYISKLKLVVEKDNIKLSYELSTDVVDMKSYIKMFDKNWELTKRIYELENRQEVGKSE